jgi:hypothetical protein
MLRSILLKSQVNIWLMALGDKPALFDQSGAGSRMPILLSWPIKLKIFT